MKERQVVMDKESFQQKSSNQIRMNRANHWVPPLEGILKVNTDAGFLHSDDNPKGSIGWLCRDAKGSTMYIKEVGDISLGSAFLIEAYALRDAMSECLVKNWKHAVFETDCEVLVKFWEKGSSDNAELAVLGADILKLSKMFHYILVLYTPRKCNRAAHAIAAFFLHNPIAKIWETVIPDWLVSVVNYDLLSLST